MVSNGIIYYINVLNVYNRCILNDIVVEERKSV